MEEILSLNGSSFKIWYQYPEERDYAIYQAESMNDGIISLGVAASCPTQVNRTVGQSIVMAASPTSGTPPYTYSFYKVPPGSTTNIWLLGTSTAGQSLSSYTYPLTNADLSIGSTKLKVGVIVFDSCSSGSLTSEEWCFINVTCAAPVANLTIT